MFNATDDLTATTDEVSALLAQLESGEVSVEDIMAEALLACEECGIEL